MKTFVTKLSIIAVCLGASLQGLADDGHHHQEMGDHKNSAHDGKSLTLTGELIGLTCFIKHGSKGSQHKSCAEECAKKGLPIGLLVDGKIFQISGDGHESLVETYKPLLKYMESKVLVMGEVFEKDGVSFLVIEKIKKG